MPEDLSPEWQARRDRVLGAAAVREQADTAGVHGMLTSPHPPGMISRLVTERGFWTCDGRSSVRKRHAQDRLGGVRVICAGDYGPPRVFDLLVLGVLISRWSEDGRSSPFVRLSARGIASTLGLSDGAGVLAQVRQSVERLKFTGFQIEEAGVEGGRPGNWSLSFSLLDQVMTEWSGAPGSPYRHLEAKFSDVLLAALDREQLRPFDLAAARSIRATRPLALRLFLYLETLPAGRTDDGRRTELLIDEALAATLGVVGTSRKELHRSLRRAALVISGASPRYEVVVRERRKRDPGPGAPTHVLVALRRRASRLGTAP